MMSFRDGKIENISYGLTVVNLLQRINEYKGKQALYKMQSPELLDALLQVAKIQSAESSNRIEGIFADDKRIALLVKEKVEPRNRDEAEIAGYRDCLELIHASAEHMQLRPKVIQQLHRMMMQLSTGHGGNWKSVDNHIRETLPSEEQVVRFVPTPAWQTPEAMEELCQLYLLSPENRIENRNLVRYNETIGGDHRESKALYAGIQAGSGKRSGGGRECGASCPSA